MDAAANAAAPGTNACPLCGHVVQPQRVRPGDEWLFIVGCECDGYFVQTELLETYFPKLLPARRQEVARYVREYRAMGHEVWCTTAGGMLMILRLM